MPEPIIFTNNNFYFQNWHRTAGVGGEVEHFFTPQNRWSNGVQAKPNWQPGLQALSQLVQAAEAAHERIRCVGSAWSLNNTTYCRDRLVNTARLSNYFVGFSSDEMVVDAYRAKKHRLVFAQCGTQIVTLNNALERAEPERLVLPTCGASNGQTLAGSTQTGTHGSAHRYGPMPNFVRALHLVGEGGKHYLLQSNKSPVVTRAFANYLGAEPLDDDELFQAAVVGLGSFGLIHALLVEAVPIFGLGRWVKQLDFDDVKQAIYGFDPRGLGLPSGDALPWHFEVVVNPYLRRKGQKGAFVRTYDKIPIARGEPLPRIPVDNGEPQNSEDLVTIGGLLSDLVPAAIPGLLQGQMVSSLSPTGNQVIVGTPGGQFTDSRPTNGGTSLELGFHFQDAKTVSDIIFGVTDRHAMGVPVAFRWVKGSAQTLSFSRFTPVTCHVEMPGIDSARTREGYRLIWQALDQAGVKYTCHWGQALPANPSWVQRAFGPKRVQRWLAARRAFLPTERGRWMFSNALLDSYFLGS